VAKLIIFSIVLMSFVVPIWVSAAPQPRRAVRQLRWVFLAFVVVWAYLCTHWYPAIVPLK
jgi:hypothetical protein